MDFNGFSIKGYDVVEEIGEGGAGRVYKAYHKNLRKSVVIKQLKESVDEGVQRVEVDILKDLHHPYLPQVFDFFIIDGIGYTVMDFVEGESLKKLLDRGVKFTEKQVLKYAEQVCEALAYLHSRRMPIIHGDIKPDNIMLTPEDNICLIDFNISGISNGDSAYTFGYTKGYAAPEQIAAFNRIVSAAPGSNVTVERTEILDRSAGTYDKGTEILDRNGSVGVASAGNSSLEYMIPIDKRCDVYSLGATLYHLYTGRVFDPANAVLDSKTSEGFLHFLNTALNVDPAKRYQDGAEMLHALKNLYKFEKSYKRKVAAKWFAFIAFLIVVVGVVTGIRMYRNYKQEEINSQYDGYIASMYEYSETRDENAFEKVFEEAVALCPERMEAYYSKALFLYYGFRYEDCIDFIRYEILENSGLNKEIGLENIYYLLGNCMLELEDYKTAISELKNSLKYDTSNPAVYVDLSIAYARREEYDKADEALESAINCDSEYSGIYLARGEIKLAENDPDSAIEEFERCLESTKDEYMTMRAYVMYSRALSRKAEGMEGSGAESIYEENIGLLTEAINKIDITYSPVLLERLTQVEIDAYKCTSDTKYANLAIDTLLDIEKAGTATFSTYNNLLIMYYYCDRFSEEKALLDRLAEDYSENYVVFLRYAQYELAIQNQKNIEDRDYHDFDDYYNKAFELYDRMSADKKNDPEMAVLNATHEDVVNGHWLD